ncbi:MULTISPECIES: ABC transporter ATP-binding protein [unclassified Chelatococcus]|uniref:ABC transporter ATP-binding protein n=1 Tax=unclassified Chelatococcus TaxID=2638111 RepID=UPI001BD10D77|nr:MULTISPECIES: ABC transporter ATP-binding protein [unclassified Chelatococcus]MBS7700854.1 ABC transporter ATP-binding protein [Chelatococcus sp. YT9]MBX3555387.1 ABC transporter ATP-binding protein [Chelatococcus sp.]
MKSVADKAIQVESVYKRYGQVAAVNNVSFDVHHGEFVSLLGPSGCGKTTTLRMIAGFIMASDGSIRVNGRDVTHLPPEKREVGFVFQNYALWPHMTVAENVAFGLKLRKRDKASIKRKIEESLAVTGLAGYEDRLPRQLSGGQQQRVALARALALEPQLLLMDEPLSNLDRALRVAMRRELKQLQKRLNMTTLYVTHDQEEALSMSDRVVIMSGGEIARIARPFEVYEDPQSEFVADFVGTTNFFNGKVAETADGIATVRVGSSLVLHVGRQIQVAKGAEVRVLLRPERVRILAAPQEGPNVLKARIDFVEYFGPTIRYTAQLESGESLYIETHNVNRAAEIGENVWLAIEPHHFRLIDAQARQLS